MTLSGLDPSGPTTRGVGSGLLEGLLPPHATGAEVHGDLPETLFAEEAAALAGAVPKRVREFTTGRACARRALARLGVDRAAMVPGERGLPPWPPGTTGSITHCDGYRAAAAARTDRLRALGIDAEPDGPLPPGVLDVVASPPERAALIALAGQWPDVSWDRLLFCAKEAVYKAWFPIERSWLGFDDVHVDLDPRGRFTVDVLVTAAHGFPRSTAAGPRGAASSWRWPALRHPGPEPACDAGGVLTFSMSVSLDGFVADRDGGFGWSAPTDEQFRVHLAQVGELGGHLCGRRLYETMLPWETDPSVRETELGAAFADVWTALPKVVFSRTLDHVQGNARLAQGSVAEEVATMLDGTDRDVAIGGATLAAEAIEQGLVDELRLFRNPVVVGGGTPYLPPVASPIALDLVETTTYAGRVVYERYRRAATQ